MYKFGKSKRQKKNRQNTCQLYSGIVIFFRKSFEVNELQPDAWQRGCEENSILTSQLMLKPTTMFGDLIKSFLLAEELRKNLN